MKELYTHINPEDNTLLEMAEVGRIDYLIIRVYGNEGPIPHFHFVSRNGEIDGCIRIDKLEYFVHGKHKDKLNGKNLKNIVEFLKAPYKKLGKYDITNWDIICMYWDDSNIDYLLPENLSMPNYEELK